MRNQETSYAAQVAVPYEMAAALTLSASYFYTWGRETPIDPVHRTMQIRSKGMCFRRFAALPAGRLMFQYGSGIESNTGLFEERRFNIRFVQVY